MAFHSYLFADVMRFHFKLCGNIGQIKLADIEVSLASDKLIDILILLFFLGPLEQRSNFSWKCIFQVVKHVDNVLNFVTPEYIKQYYQTFFDECDVFLPSPLFHQANKKDVLSYYWCKSQHQRMGLLFEFRCTFSLSSFIQFRYVW